MFSYSKDIDFDFIFPALKAPCLEQMYKNCAREVALHLEGGEGLLLQRLLVEHCLVPACVGDGLAISDMSIRALRTPLMVLVTLDRGLDFDAPDGLAVRLFCIVLSPEKDGALHLRRLSRVSRLLKDQALQQKICAAHSGEDIRALLVNPDGWLLAA